MSATELTILGGAGGGGPETDPIAGPVADEALALAQSLESGDAWSGKAEGFVPVVQGDDTVAWEAPSGGGGSIDLSAVDQDIVLLNSHVADFQGDIVADSATHVRVGWRDDNYGLCVVGAEGAPYTDVYVQSALDRERYVNISTSDANVPGIGFRQIDGAGPFHVNAHIRQGVADDTLVTGDLVHTAARGPILQAPDASLHRLIVANDGTLSTEPVV